MAFWLDIAAFVLKALIIVAAIGGLALLIARLARSSEPKDEEIKVRSLNERYDDMRDAMNAELLDKKAAQGARQGAQEGGEGAKARRDQELANASMCSPSRATCARARSSGWAPRSTPC